MKLKKILSTILVAINFNFITGAFVSECSAMTVTCKVSNGFAIPNYRCMRCGKINSPNFKTAKNSGHMIIYCKNCRNKERAGKNHKFKPYNPDIVNYTRRFGVCPNSQPGKPHLGYINDTRINKKTSNMSRLQLVNGKNRFYFYCYDCRESMIITPNLQKTSDN